MTISKGGRSWDRFLATRSQGRAQARACARQASFERRRAAPRREGPSGAAQRLQPQAWAIDLRLTEQRNPRSAHIDQISTQGNRRSDQRGRPPGGGGGGRAARADRQRRRPDRRRPAQRRSTDLLRRRHQRPARRAGCLRDAAHLSHRSGDGAGHHRRRYKALLRSQEGAEDRPEEAPRPWTRRTSAPTTSCWASRLRAPRLSCTGRCGRANAARGQLPAVHRSVRRAHGSRTTW